MKLRSIPPAGGELWRSLHWRPQDPVWAPHETLERLRARIKQYDAYYDVWWQSNNAVFDPERPGRWVIKHWSPNSGCWSTMLIWQTDTGGYRDPDAIDAMIAAALSGDPQYNGIDYKKLVVDTEEHNQKLDEKRKTSRRKRNWDEAIDLAKHQSGAKLSISVSDHRRHRRTLRSGAVKLC